jgi:4-hydroxy-3-methylbut-2-enyl diphosphate reductase IspH
MISKLLGTATERYECIRIPLHMIPDNIMELYELHDLVHNGHVYAEIRKGMHGLPQAGRLADDRLQIFLKPHGCSPVNITAGLWKHKS